jgi:SAM-dependent methyltransferase
MPVDRAVLDLFCDLTLAAGLGASVVDVGCGMGRLAPYLAAKGLCPSGIDLSPEMIWVARRNHPGVSFEVADVRELPASTQFARPDAPQRVTRAPRRDICWLAGPETVVLRPASSALRQNTGCGQVAVRDLP